MFLLRMRHLNNVWKEVREGTIRFLFKKNKKQKNCILAEERTVSVMIQKQDAWALYYWTLTPVNRGKEDPHTILLSTRVLINFIFKINKVKINNTWVLEMNLNKI